MEIVELIIKCVDQYKFQIAMPFRHLNPNMPDNFVQAESRLFHQRRSLSKNSDTRRKYVEKIERLRDQRYIEKVHPENYQIPCQVRFLPHFATQQEKFRVVYDGSAFSNTFSNGKVCHHC